MPAVFLDYGSLGPDDIDAAPLTALLPGLSLHPATGPEQIAGRIAGAEIVLVNKVRLDRQLISRSDSLKLICLAATGTDNIDLDAAREHGVAVCNIRDYCTPSVVQHVFGMLLELTLQLSAVRSLLQSGAWSRHAHFCLLDFPSRELSGKTLGIIGLGNLGSAVAQVGQAFGMQVLAARRPYDPADNEIAASDAQGIARAGLGALLGQAQVISLHCPLNSQTRQLINADSLARMRSDAVVINTARGGLVDPEALLTALRTNSIAAAGIDVLETEPPPADDPLVAARLPNLLVTPHIAWAAQESRQRAVDELAANVAAFQRGESRNRVA
jgi:glycerate dehydrogenase